MEAIRYVSPEEDDVALIDWDAVGEPTPLHGRVREDPRHGSRARRVAAEDALRARPARRGGPARDAVREDGSVRIVGMRVDVLSGQEVLTALATGHGDGVRHLCYVNAHSLNLAHRDDAYRAALSRAELVLNDGIGLHLAARMQGRQFHENLNGSDFTIRVLSLAAREGWRVFLFGGRPGVAASARDRLSEQIDGLQIVDVCDGYGPASPEQVAAKIRWARADVVIVALGQPAQELWLDQHLEATGCHLGIGVGAFLDFASGTIRRAPRWMNRCGIEWMFRLILEPGRLWRRYIVGNPVFLWRAWRLRTAEID